MGITIVRNADPRKGLDGNADEFECQERLAVLRNLDLLL